MNNKFSIWLSFAIILALLLSACHLMNNENEINLANKLYNLRQDWTFNSKIAEQDIKNGKIKYIYNGLPPYIFYLKQQDSLAAKYGFEISFFSHEFTGEAAKGIEEYNTTVANYLTKKNGKDWKLRFDKELESIAKREDSIYNANNTMKKL